MTTGAKQNVNALLTNYVDFCHNVSMAGGARGEMNLVKMLLVNLKSVDKQASYGAVFPDRPHIDWEYIGRVPGNSIGDFGTCIRLVEFLDFADLELHYKSAMPRERLKYFHQFCEDVTASGLRLPLPQVACMALLVNIEGLVGHNVLEQYTSGVLCKPTRENVSALTARMSDYRFTVSEYSISLAWLLTKCSVRPEFKQELDLHIAHSDTVQEAMKLKNIGISVGRPRLLERLQKKRAALHNVSMAGGGSVVLGQGVDSFQNWLTRVRFPNTVSLRLKKRLYFLMSQPHADHEFLVPRLAPEGIAEDVLREKIAHPELAALASVIDNLHLQQAPFAELTLFIRSCFRAFPQRDLQTMTHLKYMKLYLASYQHAELWKTCWTGVHPLLSFQVIRDVENFVRENKLNQQALLDIMLTE